MFTRISTVPNSLTATSANFLGHFRRGDVADNRDGLAAFIFDCLHSAPGIRLAQVVHHHFGPLAGKLQGDPFADAFSGSGDDCHFFLSRIFSILLLQSLDFFESSPILGYR